MNIFILDVDPIKAAEYLCDRHIVKMCLESAQLLSTWCNRVGLCHDKQEGFYKKTHVNHPCSLWLLKDERNVRWLLEHWKAIGKEYSFRYQKTHASSSSNLKTLHQCVNQATHLFDPQSNPLHFVNCTTHKNLENVVEAYRMYYITEKRKIAKWRNREKPFWFD